MTLDRTETSRVEIDNAQVDGTGLPVRVTNTIPGGLGGDANAANQATEIAKLTSVDGKLPALTVGGRVPVELPAGSGGLTDTELRATPVPVSGPLTDTQLRAVAVPVSLAAAVALDAPSLAALETVSVANFPATQPVSAIALPLPAGAATDAGLASLLAELQQKTEPVDSQHVTVDALPAGLATGAKQDTGNTSLASIDGKDFATQTTLALIKAKTDNLDVLLSTRTKPADTQPVSIAAAIALDAATLAALETITATDGGGSLTVDAQVGTPVYARLSDGAAALIGQKAMAASLPVTIASDQGPITTRDAVPIFIGRASTFRTAGRAGTTGQKILSLHNATASPVIVTVRKVTVDLMQTVVKLITVAPPIVRLWKVTVLPTNGTALTKNDIGGSGASSASVTVLGDASADGTGSGTTLTATLPAGAILTQEFAPRFVTAAGYEPADRMEFLGDTQVTLAALEGVVLFLDYTLATQNPTTDMWIASIEWAEA